jgi:hypothetical protein
MNRLRFRWLRITLTVCATVIASAAMSVVGQAADPTAHAVTFTKDVAPIFQNKCQQCHQPNSIAPMSLITYEDARPWARSIKQRVITRQMPPWHIDMSVGIHEFKNDMSLNDAQIDTIVRWVDAGAPEGDPKDMPPPKPLVTDNEWQGVRDGFGPPDLVIRSSEYTMPAQHQDVWYRPMSDIPLTEPRWARMVEIRPTNLQGRRIVHHSIAYLVLNNDPDAVSQGTANGFATAAADPTPVDLVNRRPQLNGVGDRQGLRPVPRRHGQADSAGRENLVGPASARGRPGDHVWIRDRHLVLSERSGAEEAQLSDWVHRTAQAGVPRHPAELDCLDGWLHGAEGEHAHHELPAALPPARQSDAG